jgi:outer membrane autotransporter protein
MANDDTPFVAAEPATAALGYAPDTSMTARLPAALQTPAPVLARWHGFAEGYGFFARQGASGDVPGNSRTSFGADGGLSYDLTNDIRVGGAYVFGHSRIDLDAVGESANLNLSQGGLWANWRHSHAFVTLLGSLGAGDASTSVAPTGLGMTSGASYNLTVASLSGETGYHIDAGKLVITPTLGASLSHVHRDSFTETGSAPRWR